MSVSIKLLENAAMLIAGLLIIALGLDWVAAWFGYQTGVFCWMLTPMVHFAVAGGFLLMVLGIILWAFSFGKSAAGALIALGGVMLSFLPEVLPHYLGISCTLTPI